MRCDRSQPDLNDEEAGCVALTETNDGGSSPNPVSGRLYTVRQSPKTIIIAGGAVTQISIDGTPTGLPAGVFKLGNGETIAVTYSSTPTNKVSAD